MTSVPDPRRGTSRGAARVEGLVQIVIMLAIGAAAGAASFTHVHNLAAAHGQSGWLAWADAIVLELMSVASGLELRRRKREDTPVSFPALVLVAAVVLSLSAQVVEAERSAIGWIAAALPAAGFLAMVKIALARTGPPHDPPTTDGDHQPPVRDASPPSGTTTLDEDNPPDTTTATTAELGGDPDGLVPAAMAAADAMAREGRSVSRESLAEALRSQGYALSNARASELVRIARRHLDDPADRRPAATARDGTTST